MDETSIQHALWIAQWLGRDLGALGVDHPVEVTALGLGDIAELARLVDEEDHPAGTTLFRTGQRPSRVHIIRSGTVELSCDLGGRQVVLQILRAGDVAGDIPFFLRMTEPFDAVALENSRVLSIDSVSLHRLLAERPPLAWQWLLSVSARMATVQARLVELLAGDLEAQLAAVLVHQNEHGVVPLRQSTLAELVGGRRTSVNRVLKHLQARKLLRLRYGQVEILDEDALALTAGLAAPRRAAEG